MLTFLILLLFRDSPKFFDNNHTLFSQREIFYVLKKDTLYKYSEDRWSATKHDLDLKNYKFNVIDNDDNTYLISKGGGKVLLFNNVKLKVISNSNFWEATYQSFDFIKNDTLFSYGGYGHFNTRNKLIYFEKESREWFDIKINENNLKTARRNPIGSYNNKMNEFFIGLGVNDNVIYSNVLRFDFKTNKWDKYADIGRKFSPDYKLIPNYKLPLIIYEGEKITFDFENKIYNIYKEESSAINSFIQIHYNLFTNQFFISKKNNGFIDLIILDEKDFLKKIKSELDESDIIFFDKIFRSHPRALKYQDLMDILENSLAYETKIKKIGAAKIRIDTVLCKYCKSKDSILQSKRNIHDSRIKEMYLKID